jgi:putative transposase
MATPKHRSQPGATYFVTTNTWQRRELFRRKAVASIVEETIFRYRDLGHFLLHRYVLMPDHFHVLLTPGASMPLERAIQLIKGGSSHEIGLHLGKRFPIWQPGFTEHQVRNQQDFDEHVFYIDWNPVKAKLVTKPEEYRHGSACGTRPLDLWPVASGAEAPSRSTVVTAGLKPRPSSPPEHARSGVNR